MNIQEKIQRYEKFIGETLQPDLQQELEKRDIIYSEIAE
jgi:hypothetical protein